MRRELPDLPDVPEIEERIIIFWDQGTEALEMKCDFITRLFT